MNELSERRTEPPPWRNLVLLGVLVLVLLAVVYLSPLRQYLGRWQQATAWLRGFGLWSPLIFTTGVMLLITGGFPRLVFCVLGGSTFGFWQGLLCTQLGTLAGTYIVFAMARSKAGWVRRYVEKHSGVNSFIRRQGIPGVILARQLPVPSLLVNLACGLFSFSHRDFLVGTVFGQLPEAIPCTLIGAGLLRASFMESLGYISAAVVTGVLLVMGLRRWLGSTQTRIRTAAK